MRGKGWGGWGNGGERFWLGDVAQQVALDHGRQKMRTVLLLGVLIVAISVMPASAVTRAECGNRIVKKSPKPPKAGCYLKACQITLALEHDAKGTFCIEHRNCLVMCNKR
jgi:hypothetical protein